MSLGYLPSMAANYSLMDIGNQVPLRLTTMQELESLMVD